MKEKTLKLKWRVIPYTDGFYQVSNLGHIRTINKDQRVFNINNLHGTIYSEIMPEIREKKYDDIMVKIPFLTYDTVYGKETASVSSIVYAAFHGIYGLSHQEILHIDGNELNNSKSNLILCEIDTKKNLAKKCFDSQKEIFNMSFFPSTVTRLISEYNMKGIKQNIHVNISNLAKYSGISINALQSVIEGNKALSINDKIYKRGNGPYCLNTKLIINQDIMVTNSSSMLNNKCIFQFDNTGILKSVYNNFIEASSHNKIPISRLKSALNKGCVSENYVWFAERPV